MWMEIEESRRFSLKKGGKKDILHIVRSPKVAAMMLEGVWNT